MNRHAEIVLVGEVGDQPAGLIAAEMSPRRPRQIPIGEALNSRRYRSAEIVELYVQEAYRHKGVGRALMVEAERRLRSRWCDWVRLEVLAPNRVAQALYADLGYRVTDLRLGKALRASPPRKHHRSERLRRNR
jgi:ribosomal protein S18 acetylase RimI-like enzyme